MQRFGQTLWDKKRREGERERGMGVKEKGLTKEGRMGRRRVTTGVHATMLKGRKDVTVTEKEWASLLPLSDLGRSYIIM